jgi:predicted Zn-dependent protease|tara:strand:- start:186631 stop:188001 length:1371 start_codon:yes stop_codon:yes gene_type:complete
LQHKLRLYLIATLSIVLLCFSALTSALAAPGISLIRDSEIEEFLKEWSDDVITATGLAPNGVNIILVNSDDINAFVAGGPNIFIYTGLLLRSESPEEVIGVIAHELGHIVGGHLTRSRAAMENASYETMLGTILGVGAAILSGQGEALTAVSGAAQNYAISKYLAHSRVQESSADQAALGYLEGAKINPDGLVSFLRKLEANNLLPESQQSEYYRTHPITRNRISALTTRLEQSGVKAVKANMQWKEQHSRMKAKLLGFLSPQQVSWSYDEQENSVSAVMAHAVAAYQNSDEKQAVAKVRQLVELEADNPYYHELAGQIYADFGRLGESRASYAKANEFKPSDGLIAIAYAHILIVNDQSNDADLKQAIKLLRGAIASERRSTRLYRLLATAYGKLKNDPFAKLYLAEESYLKRNAPETGRLAGLAIRGLAENSQEWHRAQDLIFYAKQHKAAQKH